MQQPDASESDDLERYGTTTSCVDVSITLRDFGFQGLYLDPCAAIGMSMIVWKSS